MSAHVSVLAGICTMRLQGTAIFVSLIVTLPPQNFLSATSGQALLSALTVAFWMKPVSSKPWMRAGATEKTGSGSVGTGFGATTPFVGGLAVPPPPPLAYATTAPAAKTRRLMSPSVAMRRRRVLRSVLLLMHASLLLVQRVRAGGPPRLYGRGGGPVRCERRSRSAAIAHGRVVLWRTRGRTRRAPFAADAPPSGAHCHPPGRQPAATLRRLPLHSRLPRHDTTPRASEASRQPRATSVKYTSMRLAVRRPLTRSGAVRRTE